MPNTQALAITRSIPWLWWGIAALVVVFDQLTKYLAQTWLAEGEVHIVTSFFNYQLRFNAGAAFSFLADHNGWQRWFFAVIAGVVSLVLAWWIQRGFHREGRHWELLGLSLILGGALGNLYDRIVLGHVVDFIVWHYQEHEWPAFNIADAAICGGAVCLILDMLVGSKKHHA